MWLKIRLLKRLILFCIGIYLPIKFFILWIKSTNKPLWHHYALDHCILRIIICCIACIYYLHLQQNKGTKNGIVPSMHRYKLMIRTVLLQLTMTFGLLLLSSIQATLWHPNVQPIRYFSSNIDFVYRGLVEITCLAAILEELLFRGILEKLLYKVISTRLWITLTSALAFSLMHGNMRNNLLYFVMGCFFSHLYYQTKDIIYPIIAHGLHNLCATCIMYFKWDERLDLAINSLTIVTRIILAIGALLGVYQYVSYRLIQPKTKNTI
ncbi:CPBP family intramembrane glutamic endopeptidase [Candidatus Cardinium hertigii]|uniref:CPBP family intramembrane glutamic endopeptidase n=1 Tax=Candidatus Cardinium hertigii TaxID=247481 RepID=UPI003D7E0468